MPYCLCATSLICSCGKVVCAVDSSTNEEDTCGNLALYVEHCGNGKLALETSIDSEAMSCNKKPNEPLQSPILGTGGYIIQAAFTTSVLVWYFGWKEATGAHLQCFDFRQAK
jgi:hypothetical protein